jgi:hypothetical protein
MYALISYYIVYYYFIFNMWFEQNNELIIPVSNEYY